MFNYLFFTICNIVKKHFNFSSNIKLDLLLLIFSINLMEIATWSIL